MSNINYQNAKVYGRNVTPQDLNRVIDLIQANGLEQGLNYNIKRTPCGTTLCLDPSTSNNVETPFQVIKVGGGKIGVISNSHVINTSDKDTYEEDNTGWGLLSDYPSPDDAGAITVDDLSIGDKIWLSFTFDADGNNTDISIEYGTVGGEAWDEFPDPISINTDDEENPFQEYYHQIIAEITNPEDDPRTGFTVTQNNDDKTKIQVTQVLFSNLALVDARTTIDADEKNLAIMVCIPITAVATDLNGSADPIGTQAGGDIKTPFDLGMGYDWLGQTWDDTLEGWKIWFGDATGTFADPTADPIDAMDISLGEEDTDGMYFHLLLGEDEASDDIIYWQDNNHSFRLSVHDNPVVELKDGTSDTDADIGCVRLRVDSNPEVALYDNINFPDGSNQINLNIETGPEVYLCDDSETQNEITLNINDGPQLQLFDGTDYIDININDSPLINMTGEGQITLGDDCKIILGTGDDKTTYSLGSIEMGSDGTYATGADGSYQVGQDSDSEITKLTQGDLTMKADDWTFTLGSDEKTYGKVQIKDCNGKTLWIIGEIKTDLTANWVTPPS